MFREGLDKVALKKLNLKYNEPDLKSWNVFLDRYKNPKGTVKIGLIGKYIELQDSYKSILESFIHAGAVNEVRVEVIPAHSEHINQKNVEEKLNSFDGILVAPGFGERGVEGKIEAIKYVRINKIPFFGICYGMQMAVIEFARNKLNLKKATSSEFDKRGLPLIGLINEWVKDGKIIKGTDKDLGGTMRLGSYDAKLKDNSLIRKIYGKNLIKERHRHRYEVNINYKETFEKNIPFFSNVSL
jgi:CTP synthase